MYYSQQIQRFQNYNTTLQQLNTIDSLTKTKTIAWTYQLISNKNKSAESKRKELNKFILVHYF